MSITNNPAAIYFKGTIGNNLAVKKFKTLIIGIFLLLFSNSAYAQLAGYSFKKKITIDNTKVSILLIILIGGYIMISSSQFRTLFQYWE